MTVRKVLFFSISFVLVFGLVFVIEFSRQKSPYQRDDITMPIYTLGDHSYELALQDNKAIVKFGPLFFGLYPGGLAFASSDAARRYLIENNWAPEKWGVYRLSGDYNKDVVDGRIDKALLVVEKVVADN